MSEYDAVDGSSTGTEVPWMWVLLRPPRFRGAKHASGHDSRLVRVGSCTRHRHRCRQGSSESDSKGYPLLQALARRRESNRMLAIVTHASALAMVASKSLARRRLRPNQAKVRSTTQRRASGLKVPMLCDRVTISIVHAPRSASAWRSFGPR